MAEANWPVIEKALQDFVVAGSGLTDANVMWSDGKPRPSGAYIAMALLDDRTPAEAERATEPNPLELADDVVEAIDGDALTLTAHAYVNADGPVRMATTVDLPAPLATGVDYWIIVDDANTIRIAASRADAIAGTAITLTDAGGGVHTIVDIPATRRKGAEIVHIARGQVRCELQLQCFAAPAAGVNTARAILRRLVQRAALPSMRTLLSAAGIGPIGFDAVQVTPTITNVVVFEPRAVTTFAFHVADEARESGTDIRFAEVTRNIAGVPPLTTTYVVGPPESDFGG